MTMEVWCLRLMPGKWRAPASSAANSSRTTTSATAAKAATTARLKADAAAMTKIIVGTAAPA